MPTFDRAPFPLCVPILGIVQAWGRASLTIVGELRRRQHECPAQRNKKALPDMRVRGWPLTAAFSVLLVATCHVEGLDYHTGEGVTVAGWKIRRAFRLNVVQFSSMLIP